MAFRRFFLLRGNRRGAGRRGVDLGQHPRDRRLRVRAEGDGGDFLRDPGRRARSVRDGAAKHGKDGNGGKRAVCGKQKCGTNAKRTVNCGL